MSDEKVVHEFYDGCKFEIRNNDGDLSYWMFDSVTESWLYLATTETEMLVECSHLAARNRELEEIVGACAAKGCPMCGVKNE